MTRPGATRPSRLASHLTRTLGSLLLLALPVGFYAENPDSIDFVVGVHGGTGQLVSVLHDCSGNTVAYQKNTFHDYSVSAYLPVARIRQTPVVAGVRAGHFDTQALVASRYPLPTDELRTRRDYINPNISLELRNVGFGFGAVIGDIPASFSDLDEETRNHLPVSAHLRVGDIESAYALFSLMENTPLLSGGSYFDCGIGYTASRTLHGYSAVSLGFYDHVGFLQQARVRLNRSVDFELTLRLGESERYFEGSVAGGIRIAFGR